MEKMNASVASLLANKVPFLGLEMGEGAVFVLVVMWCCDVVVVSRLGGPR